MLLGFRQGAEAAVTKIQVKGVLVIGKSLASRRDPGRYYPGRTHLGVCFATEDDSGAASAAGYPGPSRCAGHPRHNGTLRGVDDHLANNRLSSGSIDQNDARELVGVIDQDLRWVAAEQEVRTGLEHRRLKDLLDAHGCGRLLVGEGSLHQFTLRSLSFVEPESHRCADVLPEIRARADKQHLRAFPGRLRGCGNGAQASSHNDHIHPAYHRDLPLALMHAIGTDLRGRGLGPYGRGDSPGGGGHDSQSKGHSDV